MEIKKFTHIGDGKFKVTMDNGEIKDAGANVTGMIRYVYFEDYSLPEIGWEVEDEKLLKDYHPKVMGDILSGKIKPNQIND